MHPLFELLVVSCLFLSMTLITSDDIMPSECVLSAAQHRPSSWFYKAVCFELLRLLTAGT